MNEMNSLTHSCMHSFASFAILALSGSAVFMIRATGAKLRMLASYTSDALSALVAAAAVVDDSSDEARGACGDDDLGDEWPDMDGVELRRPLARAAAV